MDREGGFIKLHRQLLSSPVWKMLRGDQRAVLIEILFLANWKPGKAFWHGRPYDVGRGELSCTLETIAHGDADAATGACVGVWVVRSTVALLLTDHGNGPFLSERYPFPHTGPRTGPRVLKVVNYDKFQDVPEEPSRRGSLRPHTEVTAIEEGEEGEEQDHAERREQVVLLPRPPPSTPFGCFVAETWPDVPDADLLGRRLGKAYPGIDLLAEARHAFAWEAARPRGRKRDHARFLTNWMGNARPARGPAAAPARREVVGFEAGTGKPIYREA